MRKKLLAGLAVGAMILGMVEVAQSTSINPIDDGGWQLIAHMSNSGGMFDGNGNLMTTYSFGSYYSNPTSSTSDFQREFTASSTTKILFITGDSTVWGITSYNDLRTLIDARGGDSSPNIQFEIGVNGVISNTIGNVLSRSGYPEDPWISISGNHYEGIANRIVWGENNWGDNDFGYGFHETLKNNHGGINVYVRDAAPVPEPATMLLMGTGLAGLLGARRQKKK